jgi:hypothetical protein
VAVLLVKVTDELMKLTVDPEVAEIAPPEAAEFLVKVIDELMKVTVEP